MIRVVLADDHALVRRGLRLVLERWHRPEHDDGQRHSFRMLAQGIQELDRIRLRTHAEDQQVRRVTDKLVRTCRARSGGSWRRRYWPCSAATSSCSLPASSELPTA